MTAQDQGSVGKARTRGAPVANAVVPDGPRHRAFILFIGAATGAAVQFDWFAYQGDLSGISGVWMLFRVVVSGNIFMALFWMGRALVRTLAFKLPLSAKGRARYLRYDTLIYAVFLLTLTGAIGVQLILPVVAGLMLLFLMLQALLIGRIAADDLRDKMLASFGWLLCLFLLSGFAALIYQVVWQRTLFAVFGVNVESVTVIVSVFMFGLGIGALAGGVLSKRYPAHLPYLFVTCELLIGGFGLVSLPVIRAGGGGMVHYGLLSTFLTTFLLLCFPTLLMGATLPILVAYLHRHYRHIGQTVGLLYCVNTLGSAIACFVTVDLLFAFFGQQAAVRVAAGFNFSVGVLVFALTRAQEGRSKPVADAADSP